MRAILFWLPLKIGLIIVPLYLAVTFIPAHWSKIWPVLLMVAACVAISAGSIGVGALIAKLLSTEASQTITAAIKAKKESICPLVEIERKK